MARQAGGSATRRTLHSARSSSNSRTLLTEVARLDEDTGMQSMLSSTAAVRSELEVVDPQVRRCFERFLAGWAIDLLEARRLGLLSFGWNNADLDADAE